MAGLGKVDPGAGLVAFSGTELRRMSVRPKDGTGYGREGFAPVETMA